MIKHLPRIDTIAVLAVALLCANALTVPTYAQPPTSYVQPINWSRYNGQFGVKPGDTFGQSLVNVLQKESRFELNSIHSEYPIAIDGLGYPGLSYYYAFSKFGDYGYEQSLRPLSGFAYGTAALIATGTYSPAVAGMSQAQALERTEMAIRGVAFAHRANHAPTGLQFGGRGSGGSQWQAALWASQAAEAAWFVWNDLAPETRTLVAKMVEYEANSFTTYNVPYWRNPNGTINFAGDTKAEENAWNGHMVAVAQAIMPNHPNVGAWRNKASELQVSSFAKQSDATSTKLVDEKPANQWLKGFNAFTDGVVVNHNRVHPDYMASIFGQTASIIDETLAGQYIPESTIFNFDNTYRALTELHFTPGSAPYGTGQMQPPGGTIFRRNASGRYEWAVYYPQQNDWTNQVTDSYLNTDLTAEWLGLDAGKNYDAMGWAKARVNQLAVLQSRPGHNGNIYQPGDWFVDYHGFDEVIYQSNAAAWLQWWLMANDRMSPVAGQWGMIAVPEPNTVVLPLLSIVIFSIPRPSFLRRSR